MAFIRKLVVALTFGVAFVINPAYVAGCGSTEEDEPEFGEAEMVALLEDFNADATAEIEVGDALYEVELDLHQSEGEDIVGSRAVSAFASTAYACGTRTFMQSASACVTTTELVLEGTLSVRRVDGEAPVVIAEGVEVQGFMTAHGNHLSFVTIDVSFVGGRAHFECDDSLDFTLYELEAEDLGDDGVDIRFE